MNKLMHNGHRLLFSVTQILHIRTFIFGINMKLTIRILYSKTTNSLVIVANRIGFYLMQINQK